MFLLRVYCRPEISREQVVGDMIQAGLSRVESYIQLELEGQFCLWINSPESFCAMALVSDEQESKFVDVLKIIPRVVKVEKFEVRGA